jgi:hypothetical protein
MSTMMTKDEMIEKMGKGPLVVTFTKANGDLRRMVCTLRDVPYESYRDRATKAKPNIVTVWDAEAQDWRCFKLESVISVEEVLDVVE